MMPRCALLATTTCCLALLAPAVPAAPAAPVADDVAVLRAEVGLLGARDEAGRQRFSPGTVLPLRDGQEFAWRLVVKTNKPFVRVRDVMTMRA